MSTLYYIDNYIFFILLKPYENLIKMGIKSRIAKNYEEAIINFDKAIELRNLNPKKAYNEKGVTLFEIHEYDKAICCFDKCIEIDPKDSDYYANKAATLLNIEQYDNALEVINKAIELNSNDSSTHNIRGRLNNKIFINYTIYVLKNLGIILLNLKNYDDALCSFSRSTDLNPKDAKYHKSKGIYKLTF